MVNGAKRLTGGGAAVLVVVVHADDRAFGCVSRESPRPRPGTACNAPRLPAAVLVIVVDDPACLWVLNGRVLGTQL